MKDARYLIRLANAAAYQPVDQERLLADVRRLAQAHNGRTMNLRISTLAIEFDLFCAPNAPLDPFFQAWAPLGDRLTAKRLDVPPGPIDPALLIKEARELFQQQRFWEVHEVLEGLWRQAQGNEKHWVQGLILLAAALVHLQKNETAVAGKMMGDALQRMESSPEKYYEWDLAALKKQFRGIMKT